ncbi:hypothetical protein IC762_17880 [Bradyrhizobium genosp. L]|uniref:hypothetical protein n=1 Tax=Bradyrhizobium genosp. L TaxID=83637 RepID=UPI0018A2E046|nr:hypothetical protein [Bradyrhizobium genosp. L]QPF81693.1 hypothetical protein IC762_17880 [Bradyrhizobium genosp. L]
MGISFEWTFRIGDILTFFGALSVAAAFLYRRGGDETRTRLMLEALKDEIKEMKTEFKAFGETVKQVATQGVQIGMLMKWYDELRRGEGFVKGARGVDREYP